MVKLEGRQVATVALVSEPFIENAKLTAESAGYPVVQKARLRTSALSNLNPDEIKRATEPALDEVIKALTTEVAVDAFVHQTAAGEAFEVFEGTSTGSAWDSMNEAFLEFGWGDGFPLVPPTEQKVSELLKTTRRDPDEVIGILEPGMGMATVRKIAINAVMAGCLPRHRPLPILIAAVKALTDPRMLFRVIACSTGPHAPMMVINGPIRKEIGLNCEGGALGPGAKSHTNSVLGRALRLIMMNIGYAYLGAGDMDTIGSPNKYSMCLGENEEENPWGPYHVDMGYRREDSTVTVFGVESQLEIFDYQSQTPEGILQTFAGTIPCIGSCSTRYWLYSERWADNCLLMSPDHAAVMAAHGWTKEDVQYYIYEHAKLPAKFFKNTVEKDRTRHGNRWVFDADDATMIPIAGAPDWFRVVVVGMASGKSSYTTGTGKAVTVKIED